MGTWKLREKWTQHREDWLGQLAECGPGRRGDNRTGPVGFACMQFGWTQWVKRDGVFVGGEELTDLGREVLARWRAGDRE